MERAKFSQESIEAIASRTINDDQLVQTFHDQARSERDQAQSRRVHLKPYPTWLANTQWKPGQSGNPSGRPRLVKISTAVQNRLREIEPESGKTYAELIAIALVNKAVRGDVAAARELREVTEGMLTQKLEVSGEFHHNLEIENASEEELDGIIQSYLERIYGNRPAD